MVRTKQRTKSALKNRYRFEPEARYVIYVNVRTPVTQDKKDETIEVQ